MLDQKEILEKLKSLKPYLFKEFGVSEIGVFGSVARNESTESSDIDILVNFERPLGWKFFSLQLYLEQIFQRKIDLVTKDGIKEQLKKDILTHVNYI
ncbi:nucleotidyltransferase family protein [Leeuwenhoekiella sp. A16]|uniref:nucleotidyltransferase family protein n=1 Tax=unclassified Leeuwenhoekiella TaxID=2615029 RepID=UPI000C483AD8|nr:nucleotidyltransferase [Pseudooceanicola sp.]|tara:strand:+ start:249 stop:539 length:291 start_codon:yes stop_codon:yes gene_type:complete